MRSTKPQPTVRHLLLWIRHVSRYNAFAAYLADNQLTAEKPRAPSGIFPGTRFRRSFHKSSCDINIFPRGEKEVPFHNKTRLSMSRKFLHSGWKQKKNPIIFVSVMGDYIVERKKK